MKAAVLLLAIFLFPVAMSGIQPVLMPDATQSQMPPEEETQDHALVLSDLPAVPWVPDAGHVAPHAIKLPQPDLPHQPPPPDGLS